jgi:glycosyltransferase involved in cell wall biosynthesis
MLQGLAARTSVRTVATRFHPMPLNTMLTRAAHHLRTALTRAPNRGPAEVREGSPERRDSSQDQGLLSVIIPVYNEARTVGEVVDRVAALPIAKEIIVVDDGSTDDSLQVLADRGDQIRVVHESRVNQGKGTAIRIGLTYARGDVVIIQDADLELRPEEYERLLEPLRTGADVVYGSRFMGKGNQNIPHRTVLANRLLTGLTNLLYGSHLTDMETAYKVVRRRVLTRVKLRARRFEFEPELTARLLRLGVRIVEVPVSYTPRTADEGKKINWRDGLQHALLLIKLRLLG